jgi:Reverse transcriptase (RNA-dependent DNA polymerase)/Type II intron maturase
MHDNRFLRLLRNMLRAGYLEDWEWNATLSGCPQGGVVSPILSNIYLHRLDDYVETVLIPEYTRGKLRRHNPEYQKVQTAIVRADKGDDRAEVRKLRRQLRRLPAGDQHDPGYRRLRYARYADDHLLGFIGPKAEADQIKQRLARFLREDLKLELSQDKTLITHARSQRARFLGYEISVRHANHKTANGRRSINGVVALHVPATVIKAKCTPYLRLGKPEHRPQLRNLDDHLIVATYGAQYRGLVQYYLLAGDVWKLNRLHWVMLTSMLKTLAAKHRSSVTTMVRKHKTTITTPYGPRVCFEARVERTGRRPLVTRFGGIPLRRQKTTVLADRLPAPATRRAGTELTQRLLAGRCELCDKRTHVQIHQIRNLADLAKPGRPQPAWAQLMTGMRRKTLVVCSLCHDTIHARRPAATLTE